MCSLISPFVISLLERIISRFATLATSEIPIFKIVSVAEEAGLSIALSEIPELGFVTSRPTCSLLTGPQHSVIKGLTCTM